MTQQDNGGWLGISMRQPPASIVAEQALLGAMMANNAAYERVAEYLRPEHFADPIHGKIYEAISARINSGRIADAVTLRLDFENTSELDDVGGTVYLGQILSAMVGVINAGEYGKSIYDTWLRRQMIDAGETLVNESFGTPDKETAEDVLERHETTLLRLSSGAHAYAQPIRIGEAANLAITASEKASLRDGIVGIPSGLSAIDNMLSGLQHENLILIGGRPSMGKSALLLSMAARAAAWEAAQGDKSIYFWSGEMPPEQIAFRLLAARTGMSTTDVASGSFLYNGQKVPLNSSQRNNLKAAKDDIEKLPIILDTQPGLSVAQIRTRCRRLAMKGKLSMVVLDYVQLIRASADATRSGLYTKVTEVSNDLMMLKAELKVPLVVGVQLNRANEGRDDKMPQLSDLRDSGALEQDANVVGLLHRPHYYLMRTTPVRKIGESDADFASRQDAHASALVAEQGKAMLNLAKNRNGGTGIINLAYKDEQTWFCNEDDHGNWASW